MLILITLGSFLRSQALQQFLADSGATRIGQIHPTLLNRDRLQVWIERERLLSCPLGTGFNAVLFEFLTRHKDSPGSSYIQHCSLESDGTDFLIICFTANQARQFCKVRSFQMDMTFKRVAGRVKEIAFVNMNETTGKAITLARAFVCTDTEAMYEKLFKVLFPLVGRIGMGQEITQNHGIDWYHLHHRGIEAVIVDMCAKQAKGLGMFLHSIDKSKSWSDHLQHVLIFCRVYIQRKLHQKFRDTPEYTLMDQIFTENNKSKFDIILGQLLNSSNLEVRNWAKNKNVDWRLAGMSRCYTKMPAVKFDSFEKNSNLVESTHSLLAGIKESQTIDENRINNLYESLRFGTRKSYKVTTPISRKRRGMGQPASGSAPKSARAAVLDDFDLLETIDLTEDTPSGKRRRPVESTKTLKAKEPTTPTPT
ncbi:hypothetical protein Egran_04080 [Elaphomyces granulatus]|uniref:MULE transposase domain-containing protein n=1 Tax=Elaphomyces granulatus TaxID=519963 RepID=A0A232LWH6_9EURO|nr:hypothetical protein Egran_04080 [Elaphomyces granulatus]